MGITSDNLIREICFQNLFYKYHSANIGDLY